MDLIANMPLLISISIPILLLVLVGRRAFLKWEELKQWIGNGNSLITEFVSRGSYFFLFLLFASLAL